MGTIQQEFRCHFSPLSLEIEPPQRHYTDYAIRIQAIDLILEATPMHIVFARFTPSRAARAWRSRLVR